MTSGHSNGQPEPEQAAMITSWAIYGAAVQWSQRRRAEPVRDYVQEVLPIIMASLSAQVAGVAPKSALK